MKRNFFQAICFTILPALLGSCGYVVEANFLPKSVGGRHYRQAVLVDNAGGALNDYQVRIPISSANTGFWNGIENDARSIHFTADDGTTSLSFFLDSFDYSGQNALFYVCVPSLPGAAVTTIYLYFGDAGAVSESSGADTFVFYDDFEDGDAAGWQTYSSGSVQYALDGSNGVLLKTAGDNDPNGGYSVFPGSVTVGSLEAIFRTNRINESGGAANRYAVEDSGFNGYGPQISNFGGGEIFRIEERSGGTGSTLFTDPSPPSLAMNTWYTVVLRCYAGNIEVELYDATGSSLAGISATDPTVSSFDRFVIHGGYEYWTDDLRVRRYASPDPSVSFGAVEDLW